MRRPVPPDRRRLGLDACDLLGGVGQRLAPQAVDVGLRGAHLVGRVGRSAEGDLRAGLLHREHVGHEVVRSGSAAPWWSNGSPLGPRPLHDLDVLAGAVVALVVAQRVAFALLLVVVAAGDEVHA